MKSLSVEPAPTDIRLVNWWNQHIAGITNLYRPGRGSLVGSSGITQAAEVSPEEWPAIEFKVLTGVTLHPGWQDLLKLPINPSNPSAYDLEAVTASSFLQIEPVNRRLLMEVLATKPVRLIWRPLHRGVFGAPGWYLANADAVMLMQFLKNNEIDAFKEAVLHSRSGSIDLMLEIVGKRQFISADMAVQSIAEIVARMMSNQFSGNRQALSDSLGSLLKQCLVSAKNGEEERLGLKLGEALRNAMIRCQGNSPTSGAIVGTVLGGYMKFAADLLERDSARNERFKRGSSVLWSILGSASFPGAAFVAEVGKALTEEAISHWGRPRSFAEMISKAQAAIELSCANHTATTSQPAGVGTVRSYFPEIVAAAGGVNAIPAYCNSQWASQWGFWVNACVHANGFR